MLRLPPDFPHQLNEIVDHALTVEGWMTRRELEFLGLLAAAPTAEGEVLEIGSYRGRSTTVLARCAALAGKERIVAVDHLLQPAAHEEFCASVRRAGVEHLIEFHRMMSWELGRTWQRPLRLLWIDGNHTYAATKRDFGTFAPFLANGAIVAIHDVLNKYEGSLRVFMEDILLSEHFGAAGMCGSIGWAQYFRDPQSSVACREDKLRLYRCLSPLVPLVAYDQSPRGLNKLRYRFLRARVPRRPLAPETWVRRVA